MRYSIGKVPDNTPAKIIHHADQFSQVKVGDVVGAFDYALVWDHDCVTEETVRRSVLPMLHVAEVHVAEGNGKMALNR